MEFTNPSVSPSTSESASQQLTARVTHVSGAESISFLQNGFPNYRFSYNPGTGALSANVQLDDGENIFRIKAANQAGSGEDQVMIRYGNARKETMAPPEVEFTTPLRSRVTVAERSFDVMAYVKNIEHEEQVQVILDGVPFDFTFDPFGRLVKTSIYLEEGENQVRIHGSNESGTAEDLASITYFPPRERVDVPDQAVYPPPVPVYPPNEPVYTGDPFYSDDRIYINNNQVPPPAEMIIHPPEVDIREPYRNNLRTNNEIEEVRAVVLNVQSKDQIRVKINGYPTRDFTYDHPSRNVYLRIALPVGQSDVSIEARNPAGTAVDEQVFIREATEPVETGRTGVTDNTKPCSAPVIRLLDPSQRPYTTNEPQ